MTKKGLKINFFALIFVFALSLVFGVASWVNLGKAQADGTYTVDYSKVAVYDISEINNNVVAAQNFANGPNTIATFPKAAPGVAVRFKYGTGNEYAQNQMQFFCDSGDFWGGKGVYVNIGSRFGAEVSLMNGTLDTKFANQQPRPGLAPGSSAIVEVGVYETSTGNGVIYILLDGEIEFYGLYSNASFGQYVRSHCGAPQGAYTASAFDKEACANAIDYSKVSAYDISEINGNVVAAQNIVSGPNTIGTLSKAAPGVAVRFKYGTGNNYSQNQMQFFCDSTDFWGGKGIFVDIGSRFGAGLSLVNGTLQTLYKDYMPNAAFAPGSQAIVEIGVYETEANQGVIYVTVNGELDYYGIYRNASFGQYVRSHCGSPQGAYTASAFDKEACTNAIDYSKVSVYDISEINGNVVTAQNFASGPNTIGTFSKAAPGVAVRFKYGTGNEYAQNQMQFFCDSTDFWGGKGIFVDIGSRFGAGLSLVNGKLQTLYKDYMPNAAFAPGSQAIVEIGVYETAANQGVVYVTVNGELDYYGIYRDASFGQYVRSHCGSPQGAYTASAYTLYNVDARLADGCTGASVTATKSYVKAGESVTFNVKVDAGTVLKRVTLNGKEVALNSDGSYVLENVTENVEFLVETEGMEIAVDYSKVTVYDLDDINLVGVSKFHFSSIYTAPNVNVGKFADGKTDVAVKFVYSTGSQYDQRQMQLFCEQSDFWGGKGLFLEFGSTINNPSLCNGTLTVLYKDSSRQEGFAPDSEAVIEVGKYALTDKTGVIYMNVDDVLVYFALYENASFGQYFNAYTGNINGAYLGTAKDIAVDTSNVTVYDMYDLNGQAKISYPNSYLAPTCNVGVLPTTGSAAFKFKFSAGTELAQRQMQFFCDQNDFWGGKGLYIDINYYWIGDIAFHGGNVNVLYRERLTNNTLAPNSEALMEVGRIVSSETSGKVYIKIDNRVVYLAEYSNVALGQYMNAQTGNVSGAYLASTYTLYSIDARLADGCSGASVAATKSYVKAGESVTFNVALDAGTKLVRATLNGKEVSLNSDGNYVLENITENVAFLVETEGMEIAVDYSKVTVYDLDDINLVGVSKFHFSSNYTAPNVNVGKFADGATNVAVKFVYSTGSEYNQRQMQLFCDQSDFWGGKGLFLEFGSTVNDPVLHNGTLKVLYKDSSRQEGFAPNSEAVIEVGKYALEGNTGIIYINVDGVLVYFALYENASFGQYFNAYTGTINGAYLGTAKDITVDTSNVTVYDVYDLNGQAKVEFPTSWGGSAKNVAKFSENDNVAIKFIFSTGSEFAQRQMQFFCEQDDFWGGKGLFIDINYYWIGDITFHGGDINVLYRERITNNALAPNSEAVMEVGRIASSETSGKVYIKIDNKVVYLAEYSNVTLGQYVNAYSGFGGNPYIKTTYEIYNISYTSSVNGYISVPSTVVQGDEVDVLITPDTGYKLAGLTLNGEAVDISNAEVIFNGLNLASYKFVPNGNTEISATFEKDEDCSITVYDFFDLAGKDKLVPDKALTMFTFGQMPKTENVAVKLVLGLGQDIINGSNRQIGFFEDPASPIWSSYGFEVNIYWEGSLQFIFNGAEDKTNYNAVGMSGLFNQPGVELLLEVGTFDIGDGKAVVYLKVDNKLLLTREYVKSEYKLSTGVGGLYLDRVDAIDDVYVRSTLDNIYNVAFKEDYSNVATMAMTQIAPGRQLSVQTMPGYVVNKITLVDKNGATICEYLADSLLVSGRKYSVVIGDITGLEGDVFVKLDYIYEEISITPNYDENVVNYQSELTAPKGGDYVLSFTIAQGNALVDVTINGESYIDVVVEENGVYVATIYGLFEDAEIVISTEIKNYAVIAKLSEGSEGATVEASVSEVQAGAAVTFTVVLEEGYIINKVTLNGKEVFLNSDGTYVVNNVKEDLEFVVYATQEETSDSSSDTPSDSSSEVPSDSSSEESSDSGTEEPRSLLAGCFGSITSMGASAIVLLGAAVVLGKRKED